MKKVLIVDDMECNSCPCKTHSLRFSFIRKNVVHFSKRCTHCRLTFQTTCSTDMWKHYLEVHDAHQCITKHHRLPKSHGGSDTPENIALVPLRKHQFWHGLFSNRRLEKVVEELNNVWIPPNKKLIIVNL